MELNSGTTTFTLLEEKPREKFQLQMIVLVLQ